MGSGVGYITVTVTLALLLTIFALGNAEMSDGEVYKVGVPQVNLLYDNQTFIIDNATVEYHDPDPVLGNDDFCDQHYYIDAYKDYTILACSIEREYVENDVLYIELSDWYTWSEQDRSVVIM